MRRFRITTEMIGSLFAALVLAGGTGFAANKTDIGGEACLACHGDKASAQKQLISVSSDLLAESVHADFDCIDCHTDAAPKKQAAGHPKRLSPVNCTDCHHRGNLQGAPDSTPMKQYQTSVHGRASIERGDTDVATCSDCHGKHNIRAASDPESTIFRSNIPRTCAVCHENMQMILKHNIHMEQPYSEYQQSVHGKALLKNGLVSMAAVCTDCHGVHDIQANREVDLKPHQPGTCGRCHLNEYLAYTNSIHGRAFKKQITDVPVCADCHGEHSIAAPWDPESSVSAFNITATCARCHDDVAKMSKYNILTDKVSTYRHSDHGMGKDLGIVSVATCVSCHTHHDILPAYDPESSINVLNLKKTCGSKSCHPDASPEMLKARIHVDKDDRDIDSLRRIRSIALWSFAALMGLGAVTGVLLFAVRVGRRYEAPARPEKDLQDKRD